MGSDLGAAARALASSWGLSDPFLIHHHRYNPSGLDLTQTLFITAGSPLAVLLGGQRIGVLRQAQEDIAG